MIPKTFVLLSLLATLGAESHGDQVDTPCPEKRHVEMHRAQDEDEVVVGRAADNIGKDRQSFKEQMRRDSDLRIAVSSGRPVYACKPPRLAQKVSARSATSAMAAPATAALVARPNVGTDTSSYINATPYPLDQTFKLHTRPGAARILFLDFDGFTVHATEWNASNSAADDIVMPPFDTDGNPATFSASERADIQEVWRRVAEDYAPFDVDVTTEDPGQNNLVYDGPGDDHWGMRMVCGGFAVDVLGPGNDGVIGVALLNSFRTGVSLDSNGNPGSDTPAFCFFKDIIAYEPTTYAAEMAYTSSHEFGHTVGLSHDGDSKQEYYPGYAGWAPIMGSGTPTDVVQWSKGEYADANNKEDDLALIAANYLPYIALDHGVSAATAVPLARGDTAGGVILKADDTAWYKIQVGAGPLSVAGSVASPSPGNLKLKLSLVDARGVTIATATSRTAGQMSATLSTTLASSGTYYLVVDGTSYLSPSTGFTEYDSVGRYAVSGSWPLRPANVPPSASVVGSLPLNGAAPLNVAFSSATSTDVDGVITGYFWDFGDGATSTLANPTHTYTASSASYTATLTVTDNDGATGSTSVPVSTVVSATGTKVLSIPAMSGRWLALSRTAVAASCAVTVCDNSGRPMPNVAVGVSISGLASGNQVAMTDRSGKAVFQSDPIATAARGSVVFTVSAVGLPGYFYRPTSNKVSAATLRR